MVKSRGWKVAQGPTLVATSKREPSAVESPSLGAEVWWRWRTRRFSAIGWGNTVLLALVFFLSSVWSFLLIILNLEPSRSANYLLQTETLDNGHFWQSRKAASPVMVTTTALLTILIVSYWYLLYLLLCRPPSSRIVSQEIKPKQQRSVVKKLPTVEKRSPLLIGRRVVGTTVLLYRNVVSTDGKYRKVWNVLMEVPEIILQILSLREYMAQGLDASLLYCYASLMAINAFVTFYHIQFRWNEATLGHILKDSILDAAFTVFFPALILLYSLFVFQDDLKAVKIRQQFFPPRVFERKARNLINAKEMNLFSTDFESLLVRSAWDVFLKLTFSLLACFRWNKITLLLLERERKRPAKHTEVNCKTVDFSPGIERSKPRRSHVRTIVGCCFLIYGLSCLAYTVLAVRGSHAACSFYPSCVQFASQWTPIGPNDVCECLAYVDRDLAPGDLKDRTDVTDTLAQLAAAGKLQTVQLVNRKINDSLPEELQTCQSLRNLVLIHTGVQEFPAWTATSFTKLEYLHIEGEATDTNLVELPSDLFASMTNLHTIHVSYHANLLNLPPLTGLKTLESVYFGYLDGVKEIPSTGDLPEIQVLALEALPLVRSLPNVAQYQTTLEMVFLQDVSICCSGFLSEGNCNTTFPTCCGDDPSTSTSTSTSSSGSGSGTLPRTCLEIPDDSKFLPSNATISLLNKFAANISNFCDAAQATCPGSLMSTKLLVENVCQGVLYRACSSESKGVGICFNEDMGPVECKYSRKIIEMRKAEIAAGCHCNKLEEQWLGCTG